MPFKDPEVRKAKHAEYSKKYYEANKEKTLERVKIIKAKNKKQWDRYKSTLSCINCGFKHPAVIDFHHVNPEEKEYAVNDLVSNKQWVKVYEEIKKCIALCANCHRIHHWTEVEQAKKAKKSKKKK